MSLFCTRKPIKPFVKKAFGRFLHHTPAAALSEKQKKSSAGLRRSWLHACQIENINTRTPQNLPLIFAIDALLNIPNGFHYLTDCKKAGLVTPNNSSHGAIYCGGDSCNSGCSSCNSCSSGGGD